MMDLPSKLEATEIAVTADMGVNINAALKAAVELAVAEWVDVRLTFNEREYRVSIAAIMKTIEGDEHVLRHTESR